MKPSPGSRGTKRHHVTCKTIEPETAPTATKFRRRTRVPYEARLFRCHLSPDEALEVAEMNTERQRLQARVAEFSEKLPDVGIAPRALATLKLPRAANVADTPLPTWNMCADRRFV